MACRLDTGTRFILVKTLPSELEPFMEKKWTLTSCRWGKQQTRSEAGLDNHWLLKNEVPVLSSTKLGKLQVGEVYAQEGLNVDRYSSTVVPVKPSTFERKLSSDSGAGLQGVANCRFNVSGCGFDGDPGLPQVFHLKS